MIALEATAPDGDVQATRGGLDVEAGAERAVVVGDDDVGEIQGHRLAEQHARADVGGAPPNREPLEREEVAVEVEHARQVLGVEDRVVGTGADDADVAPAGGRIGLTAGGRVSPGGEGQRPRRSDEDEAFLDGAHGRARGEAVIAVVTRSGVDEHVGRLSSDREAQQEGDDRSES
ncbi:MAG: hypothetical protein AAF533_15675 [Acidobacteriota bacterium]